ncbi:MAG: ABC transporter ATP-binding protein [Nanoarchaeota archaeon]|mgnify:CR=1 FL=1
MVEPLISLEGVTKHYHMGDSIVKAVDGIDITIEKGDFVAIMGPSGSGKSTAMNLVGSLDLATNGRILLEGMNIEKFSESELAQLRGKKIGFIFQSFNLIPNLTAKENIMLPMLFQKVSLDERETRSKELLKLVDLETRMDHYPNQLSGGQQQRVAIARALANDPEIILADEPTGNLDTKTGEHVMELLTNLNNQGKTIILITHAPDVATAHAKKIYWLKDGKVEKITMKKGNTWISKK